MNLFLCTDNYTAKLFHELDPYKNFFDYNAPLKVSGNLALPSPILSTVANWMHRHRQNKKG